MTSSPCIEYYKQQKQQLHCEEYRHNVTHNTFTKFHKKIMRILANLTQQKPKKFLKPPSKRIHYHMLKNKCMAAVIVIKCIKQTIEAII